MKHFLRLGIFLLFAFFGLNSILAQNQQQKIDTLLARLSLAREDTNKVNILLGLIEAHVYYKEEEGLKYEQPAFELIEKLQWHQGLMKLKYFVGRIYWHLGKYDQALEYHFDGVNLAEQLNNTKWLIKMLIAVGQDYCDQAKYPEALLYFDKALKMAEARGNKGEISGLYALKAWVYDQQGNYPESSKYQFAALKIYEERGDKVGVAVAQSNLADSYRMLGNDSMAIVYSLKAIASLKETGDRINEGYTCLGLGEIYQSQKKFNDALGYYDQALKTANEIADKILIAQCYKYKASVMMDLEKYHAALQNYLAAAEVIKLLKVNHDLAELDVEIGICYTRLGQNEAAKNYFNRADTLLKNIDSDVVLTRYYQGMEGLDSLMGNWEGAYFNYKKHIAGRDRMSNDANTKKIMQRTLQYEFDLKEAAAKAEQEKKDIVQRSIRNSIAGVLVLTLVFLVIVYRQRNRVAEAKKRSDELLLNILPSEVAEELKGKGSAAARHFNEVTVMFTDFKNFTQISENLSAEELVSELDFYFKAFDDIITKHNIEKIKTIGDSYMCAGGLPVANETHAEDVVRAAIEIQQFMYAHVRQMEEKGKEPFVIRIGIHTGPVVAGIVGIKKFAYDIWGDTVNVASRLETSGVPGKVNISGSTYALIKDKFSCTHRGKIQAKNKGEIEMYFVDFDA
jgi:adenylate cyclase